MGRNNKAEFRQFLGIATASSFELETQLILAERLELVKIEILKSTFEKLTIIQKMTYNLRKLMTDNSRN